MMTIGGQVAFGGQVAAFGGQVVAFGGQAVAFLLVSGYIVNHVTT